MGLQPGAGGPSKDGIGKSRTEAERDQSAIRNYPQLLRRYARLLEVTYNLASTFDLNTLLGHVVEAAQERR